MTENERAVEPAIPSTAVRMLVAVLAITLLTALVAELSGEKRALTTMAPRSSASSPSAGSSLAVSPSAGAVAAGRATPTPAPGSGLVAAPAASRLTSTAGAVPGQPPAAVPARSGTYRYVYSIGEQEPQSATLTVARDDAHGWVGDVQTWSTVAGTTTQKHHWTARQFTTLTSGDCRWSPAEVTLILPLHKGSHWTSRTSCANEDGSLTTISASATVKGWTRVTIGEDHVATWLIERSTSTTVTAGDVVARSSSAIADFFAPALGLTVFESVRSDYPDASGNEHQTDAVRRLLDTRPS